MLFVEALVDILKHYFYCIFTEDSLFVDLSGNPRTNSGRVWRLELSAFFSFLNSLNLQALPQALVTRSVELSRSDEPSLFLDLITIFPSFILSVLRRTAPGVSGSASSRARGAQDSRRSPRAQY